MRIYGPALGIFQQRDYMICNLIDGRCENCGGLIDGAACPAEISTDELRAMESGYVQPRAVKLTAWQAINLSTQRGELLAPDEVKELLGEDPTLAGNRLERLFQSLGIPPCGSCGNRRDWINRAHAKLREWGLAV
jgi:hypothetical protein